MVFEVRLQGIESATTGSGLSRRTRTGVTSKQYRLSAATELRADDRFEETVTIKLPTDAPTQPLKRASNSIKWSIDLTVDIPKFHPTHSQTLLVGAAGT